MSQIYLSSSLFWEAMLSLRRETDLVCVQDSVLPSINQALQILGEWANNLSNANGDTQSVTVASNGKITKPSPNEVKKKLVPTSRVKSTARAPTKTPKAQTSRRTSS